MAEIGIATRANVSGWDRARVHNSDLFAAEKRRLVLNINGASPKGAKIVKAVFETWGLPQVIMSDGAIADDQRSASILIQAQMGGRAILKGTAFMDDGTEIPQNYRINVQFAPIYQGTVWTTGPNNITVIWP